MSVKPTEQITLSAPAFHALQRAAGREGVSPEYIVELLVCWFLEDRHGRPLGGDQQSSVRGASHWRNGERVLDLEAHRAIKRGPGAESAICRWTREGFSSRRGDAP